MFTFQKVEEPAFSNWTKWDLVFCISDLKYNNIDNNNINPDQIKHNNNKQIITEQR